MNTVVGLLVLKRAIPIAKHHRSHGAGACVFAWFLLLWLLSLHAAAVAVVSQRMLLGRAGKFVLVQKPPLLMVQILAVPGSFALERRVRAHSTEVTPSTQILRLQLPRRHAAVAALSTAVC